MRQIIAATACILSVATLTGQATAQDVTITEISKTGYNVANYLRRQGDTPLTVEMAEKVKRGILSDTKIDEGERQMLDSLLAGETFTVQNQYGNTATISMVVEEDAKAVLRDIEGFTHDDPIFQLWAEGTEDSIGEVLNLYQGEGAGRAKVEKTLSDRIETIWAKSSYDDNYKPLRTEFAGWGAKCYQLSGQAYWDCREMLYQIALKTDKDGRDVTTGNLPDYLYEDWQKAE